LIFYRIVLMITLSSIIFVFVVDYTGTRSQLQYFNKYSCLYSGIFLFVFSCIYAVYNWFYRARHWTPLVIGFFVGVAAIFFGCLPLLSH